MHQRGTVGSHCVQFLFVQVNAVNKQQALVNQAEFVEALKRPHSITACRIADFAGCFMQVAVDGRDSVQADRAIDAMVALARDSVPTIVLWYTSPMSVARRGIRACGTHLGTRPFTATMRVPATGP